MRQLAGVAALVALSVLCGAPSAVCSDSPSEAAAAAVASADVRRAEGAAAPAELPSLRNITCSGAAKNVTAADDALYNFFFHDYNDTQGLVARDSLNFETLASVAGVATAGADLGEALVTLRSIEVQLVADQVPNATHPVTLASLKALWTATWTQLADTVAAEAESYADDDDSVSAASAFYRAASYYQLAERYADDHESAAARQLYNASVQAFIRGTLLPASSNAAVGMPACEHVNPPLPSEDFGDDAVAHGYLCRPSGTPPKQGSPTILAMTGYDGTAEALVHGVAAAAVARGFNVLAFEGPGQGWVARFGGLRFRPDYEAVVSPVLDFAVKQPGVDASRLILWGRSFGGYLAPRAFAHEPRFLALIADGGVDDFFQAVLCQLPDNLRSLLYSDPATFDKYLYPAREAYLSLDFLFTYGALGFGTDATKPSELYQTLAGYSMDDSYAQIGSRPVFVNDPPLDTLTGNQSEIFFAKLPRPLASSSMLHSPDKLRGSALHCSIGSTANANIAVMRFLRPVVAAPDVVRSDGRTEAGTTSDEKHTPDTYRSLRAAGMP